MSQDTPLVEISMKKAVIFPNEMGWGFDFGWFFFNNQESYALVWGNSKTRELATKVLNDNYPAIEIVQSETTWERFAKGSPIRIRPKGET